MAAIPEAVRERIIQNFIGDPEGRVKLIMSTIQPVREAMDWEPEDQPDDVGKHLSCAIQLMDLSTLLRRVAYVAEREGQKLGTYPVHGALRAFEPLSVGRMAKLIDIRLGQHRLDPEVDKLLIVSEVMRS